MRFRTYVTIVAVVVGFTCHTRTADATAQPIILVVTDARYGTPRIYTRAVEDEAGAQALEDDLRKTPGVIVSRRNILELSTLPASDPMEPSQWSLNAIHAIEAATLSGDGAGTKVAVVDSGIAVHPDLAGRVVASKDFVGVPGSKFHGTSVAGIIAANADNGIGVRGVAPGVSLLDARVCMDSISYGCPSELVANGIVWAVSQGADVINLSLGGVYDPGVATAVSYALSHNVVVVAAAGNTACRHMINGWSGAQGPNGNCLSTSTSSQWPANLPGVIAVAAITEDGSRAEYSSYGPQVTVGAPTGVLTANYISYNNFTGTSAATPHVAAVAALMRAANPLLNPSQVKAMLMHSATAYPTTLRHPTWASCGSYNSPEGYWDNCTGLSDTAVPTRQLGGAGFLNALEAVREAVQHTGATWTPTVNATTDGFVVSFTPIAGATSYEVLVDATVAVRTTSTTETITGLTAGASYAVSVRAVGPASVTSAPVVGAPTLSPLGAPVLRWATASLNRAPTVKVTADTNSSMASALEIKKVSALDSSQCSDVSEESFQCDYENVASTTDDYVVRYINQHGQPGAWSQTFRFTSASNPTLDTPVVDVRPSTNSYILEITPVPGAARYVFTAGNDWAHVSPSGTVIRNRGSQVQCLLSARLECEVSASAGTVYQVRAAVSRDSNPDAEASSIFSPVKRVVVPLSTPDFSNVRGEMHSTSTYRLRWDSTASPDSGEGFNIFTPTSEQGAWKDADGWYTDIAVDSRTPSSLDVTVEAWKAITSPIWQSNGRQESTTISVGPMAAPTGLTCRSVDTSILCSIGTYPQRVDWDVRYGFEVRGADGTILRSGSIPRWNFTDFELADSASEAATVHLRAVETRAFGRRSSWTSATVTQASPGAPVSPPTGILPPGGPASTVPIVDHGLPGVPPPQTGNDAGNPATNQPAVSSTTKLNVRVTSRGRSITARWTKAPAATSRILVLRDRRLVATLSAKSISTTLRNQPAGHHSIEIVYVAKTGKRTSVNARVSVARQLLNDDARVSKSRPMSRIGDECVSLPTLMKCTPVSVTSFALSSVRPSLASSSTS